MAVEKSYFKNKEFYKSVCPYCGVGCGVILETENGKVRDVIGDSDHPSNYGRLCTKGINLKNTIHKHDRLRHPLVRETRNSHFIDTSWDNALEKIADKFKNIIKQHGPEAIA
ncbi:MAG: molybdopterin-dependent oxidoreductase, partial [Thermodesulfobacteriota bacterium]